MDDSAQLELSYSMAKRPRSEGYGPACRLKTVPYAAIGHSREYHPYRTVHRPSRIDSSPFRFTVDGGDNCVDSPFVLSGGMQLQSPPITPVTPGSFDHFGLSNRPASLDFLDVPSNYFSSSVYPTPESISLSSPTATTHGSALPPMSAGSMGPPSNPLDIKPRPLFIDVSDKNVPSPASLSPLSSQATPSASEFPLSAGAQQSTFASQQLGRSIYGDYTVPPRVRTASGPMTPIEKLLTMNSIHSLPEGSLVVVWDGAHSRSLSVSSPETHYLVEHPDNTVIIFRPGTWKQVVDKHGFDAYPWSSGKGANDWLRGQADFCACKKFKFWQGRRHEPKHPSVIRDHVARCSYRGENDPLAKLCMLERESDKRNKRGAQPRD